MTPRGYWLNYLNIPAGARLHAAWEAKPERSCPRPSCPQSTGWRPTAPQSQAPTQASADFTQDYAELTPSSGMQRQGRCRTRVHHSLPWRVFSGMDAQFRAHRSPTLPCAWVVSCERPWSHCRHWPRTMTFVMVWCNRRSFRARKTFPEAPPTVVLDQRTR